VKPKLYQYAACPFCSKVTSLLAYKNLEYDVVEVNPLNNNEIAFSADYKKVPIFIDSDGKQFNDSNVIMKHIDETYPEKPVFTANSTEDEKWLAWSEKYVNGLPTVIYEKLGDSIAAFDYIRKVGNFNWMQRQMIKYSGAFVMTLVAKKIKKREGIEDPTTFLKSQIQEWTTGLAGRDFMGGDKPSVADIAVFGISRAVGTLKAGVSFKEDALFWSWLERQGPRPQRSLQPPISLAWCCS